MNVVREVRVCPFCLLSTYYKKTGRSAYYCLKCNRGFSSLALKVSTKKGRPPKYLKFR